MRYSTKTQTFSPIKHILTTLPRDAKKKRGQFKSYKKTGSLCPRIKLCKLIQKLSDSFRPMNTLDLGHNSFTRYIDFQRPSGNCVGPSLPQNRPAQGRHLKGDGEGRSVERRGGRRSSGRSRRRPRVSRPPPCAPPVARFRLSPAASTPEDKEGKRRESLLPLRQTAPQVCGPPLLRSPGELPSPLTC